MEVKGRFFFPFTFEGSWLLLLLEKHFIFLLRALANDSGRKVISLILFNQKQKEKCSSAKGCLYSIRNFSAPENSCDLVGVSSKPTTVSQLSSRIKKADFLLEYGRGVSVSPVEAAGRALSSLLATE